MIDPRLDHGNGGEVDLDGPMPPHLRQETDERRGKLRSYGRALEDSTALPDGSHLVRIAVSSDPPRPRERGWLPWLVIAVVIWMAGTVTLKTVQRMDREGDRLQEIQRWGRELP